MRYLCWYSFVTKHKRTHTHTVYQWYCWCTRHVFRALRDGFRRNIGVCAFKMLGCGLLYAKKNAEQERATEAKSRKEAKKTHNHNNENIILKVKSIVYSKAEFFFPLFVLIWIPLCFRSFCILFDQSNNPNEACQSPHINFSWYTSFYITIFLHTMCMCLCEFVMVSMWINSRSFFLFPFFFSFVLFFSTHILNRFNISAITCHFHINRKSNPKWKMKNEKKNKKNKNFNLPVNP